MCLILLALEAHPAHRLVVAANRDEFHERPTAPAHWWPESGNILAGRDLQSGGTWLGVTRSGRWAAVTNYREPNPPLSSAPSRGELVSDFLLGRATPGEYIAKVVSRGSRYNGFNLLVGDGDSVVWWSNRSGREHGELLQPGIYGVSNHLLDTPWPKVARGRDSLRDLLARPEQVSPDLFLDALIDRTIAADQELPDSGVGIDLERVLSSAFILSPDYGTRASTALLIDRDGTAAFVERTFAPGTTRWTEVRHGFQIEHGG